MTKAQAQPPEPVDLGTFEGIPITSTAIEITGAGAGLEDALAIDPQELEVGEEITVVIRTRVNRIGFREPGKKGKDGDDDGPTELVRVHTLKAYEAAIVPDELVADTLEAQAQKIVDAREAADKRAAEQEALAEEQRKLDAGEAPLEFPPGDKDGPKPDGPGSD